MDVQELSLVIATRRNDPALLTPEFLQQTGIVPADWELARQPVRTARGSQVIYGNGINIVSQLDRITFTEPLGKKAPEAALAPNLARSFTQTLSQGDYQAIGINFRSFVSLDKGAEAAHEFLFKRLLASGPWCELGDAPVQASLTYAYTFGDQKLTVTINEGSLQPPEKEPVPVILFNGNFSADISEIPQSQRLDRLHKTIDGWTSNLETYQQVIDSFLAQEADAIMPIPALA